MEYTNPQDARFYNVGCNFYELAVSTGYDHRDARRLSEMVQFSVIQETGDELLPFYNALRDHALIDMAFCKMLMDTGIMQRDEIFQFNWFEDCDYDDDELYEDDMEPEYTILSEEDFEDFYGDENN